MSKLKCFSCNHKFKYWRKECVFNTETKHYDHIRRFVKKQIYRDRRGFPTCDECLQEDIDFDYLDSDTVDRVFGELYQFNYSYQKYFESLYHIICPKCKCQIDFSKKTDYSFEGSCPECYCWLIIDEGKLKEWYESEDEYYKIMEEKKKNGNNTSPM